MMILDDVKLHLRVDHDDEDDTISLYLDAGVAAVANYLNVESIDLDDPLLPAPIKAAVLLAVGDLYENREGQADRHLYQNLTFENLLAPYRVLEM